MALQTLQGGLYIPRPPTVFSTQPSLTTTTLVIDAAGEKAAFVFPCTKSGNIRRIHWHTATVTTGGNVDVRLETVDATTGDPTGTLAGVNGNATHAVAAADDDRLLSTQLTADVAVTRGTYYAVVLAWSSGNMQIAAFADDSTYGAYCDLFTAAWAKQNTCSPVVGLEYDDGSFAFVPGATLVGTSTTAGINAVTYANSSTPDVRALQFSLPFPARADGFWLWADMDGDAAVKLYGSDGVTVLASATIDKDRRAATNVGVFDMPFDATANLAANTTYWLGVEPSSATSIILYDFDVPSSAAMNAHQGGTSFIMATAKDPTGTASWTAANTKRPYIGLRLDQFDDAVSAGGGIKSQLGMVGGMCG